MSSEGEAARLSERIDEISDRFEEFEAELDDAVESGRTRLRELTADLRTRFEALRGEAPEPEPEPSRLESLREDLEELSTKVEAELDDGRHRLVSLLDDLREDVRDLEQAVRRS